MEKLKFKGEELEFKFGVKALRGIEKEAGKPLTSFGTKTTVMGGDGKYVDTMMFTIDEAVIMLKHALGDKYSDEDCEAIMDENDGSFLTIITAFYQSQNKIYTIAAAGTVNEVADPNG